MIPSEVVYNILWIVYALTVTGIVIVVLTENRNPVKSLAWITVLLALPAVGIVLYIFFGRNLRNSRLISRNNRRKLRKRISPVLRRVNIQSLPLSEASRQQILLARSLQGSEYFDNNAIEVFTDGRSKFARLESDIEQATSYINLQYYIIENDTIGRRISELLQRKAREGVKVRIIYDAVGCFPVRNRFFKRMRKAGIEVYPFMKINFPQFATRLNWRNHRKVVIIDGRVGYIGGMNIADRYVDGGKQGHWRDTHLRIEGPAVAALQYSFAVDWNFVRKELLPDIVDTATAGNGSDGVQIVTSGPMGAWSNIALVMLKAIGNATRRVWLQTPYFLPSNDLLRALQTAALAKVDVRLMIPRHSDSFMLTYASRSYIKECIASGIKVYFYESGMLHSKAMIVDDEFCTVGSLNLDFRSIEHNFEGNAMIYGADFNSRMSDIMEADIERCTRIGSSAWRHRPWYKKLVESIYRLFSPIL